MRALPASIVLAVSLWAGTAPAPSLWWGKASSAEVALLTARHEDANRVMSQYGYGYHDWQIHALHWAQNDPLWRGHVAFKFLWRDERDTPSEFVLIVPASGGELRLVPVAYSGFEHQDADLDLHNVAIFNATLDADPPTGSPPCMELAELYLNLVGQLPQPVTAANLVAVAGKSRVHEPWAAPPEEEPVAGGGCRVRFANLREDAGIDEWTFTFDAGGRIRNLDRVHVHASAGK